MAFLNVEDLIGNVEVVVFPQMYERYSTLLVEDAKVFIRGRVSLEEDKDGKLSILTTDDKDFESGSSIS